MTPTLSAGLTALYNRWYRAGNRGPLTVEVGDEVYDMFLDEQAKIRQEQALALEPLEELTKTSVVYRMVKTGPGFHIKFVNG